MDESKRHPAKQLKQLKQTKQIKHHKPCKAAVVYLDNNGTTAACGDVRAAMQEWICCRSNPSSDSRLARAARDMMDATRNYILEHCGVNQNQYTVVFTSGASESNSFILRAAAAAFMQHKKKCPHIITSAVEHNSILKTCAQLAAAGLITYTAVPPNAYGVVLPQIVEKAASMRQEQYGDVALISIQNANNETGAIMDVNKIGKIAHKMRIPFHTDAVQSFGKYRYALKDNCIDAMSVSFHKMYGPMGAGLLILNNELIDGYGLQDHGQIAGSQQQGLRGGTENVPAIAAIVPCIRAAFDNRDAKNLQMHSLKMRIVDALQSKMNRGSYLDYALGRNIPVKNEFVVLGPRFEFALPNTLLIAFAKNEEKAQPFCNVQLKKDLESHNIVVSVGSACATSSPKASHVLYAMRAPPVIRQGVVRVSLSDETTKCDVDAFVDAVVKCVKAQFN